MSVVLINVFEVPAGREAEFMAAWRPIADHLATQEGYLSTKLHQALAPGARFSFVNVAEWASPQHFQAALGSQGFQKLVPALGPFPATPGLFTLAYEHHPESH